MWSVVLSAGQALESAVFQVPDDTYLIITIMFILMVFLEMWLGGPPTTLQYNEGTDEREIQAQLNNEMVQESGSTPRRTSSLSASACCNASPTKIARSLKMGQAPTLQTLSSKVSQASTDICSSPSSTAGQEEDEDDSKHMQDVK
jgi:hypothetical protein